MIRLFYRLALAIVTVLVCAGIARPVGGNATSFVTAIAVAATDTVSGTQPEEPSYWQDGASHPVVDLKAVESDIDDDDPLCHVSEEAAPAFRWVVAPSEQNRPRRGEVANDPSRFAADACLPRGPPAV